MLIEEEVPHDPNKALERVFAYSSCLCMQNRGSCVKITKLFVLDGSVDMEAMTELVKILNNKSVKNDILELTCGITF